MALSHDPNTRPALLGTPDEPARTSRRVVALADVVKAGSDDLKWLYPDRPTRRPQRVVAVRSSLILCTRPVGLHFDCRRARYAGSSILSMSSFVDTVGAGDLKQAGLISGLVDADLLGWLRRSSARARRRDQILPAIHRGIINWVSRSLPGRASSPTREEVNEIRQQTATLRGLTGEHAD